MNDFSKLDIDQFRKEKESGAEVDHNGTHFYKCSPGSFGRFIKDWQDNKFKNQESNQKLSFPKPRDNSGKTNQNRYIKTMNSAEEKTKSFILDPIRETDHMGPLFIQQIQKALLEKMKFMPLFVIRAMYAFSDEKFINFIIEKSDTRDIIQMEIIKTNSKLINIFVECFSKIAEKIVEKYHRLVKMARDISRMNPEDLRINNIHNISFPISSEQRHLVYKDELEIQIISDSIDQIIIILKKRKTEIETELLKLNSHIHPKPIGGTFLIKQLYENKPKKYRVCAKMLQANEDPSRIFGYDPEAYEVYKRMNPEQSFKYLLPKRSRDRLLR